MSALLAKGAQGAGLAKGSQAFSVEREAERSAARATKEMKDQELKRLKATAPTEQDLRLEADAQTLQIQNLVAQQTQQLAAMNRQRTFDAFSRYDDGDRDIRHINTMLTDLSKTGSSLYGDIARVDKVTEADSDLMIQTGLINQAEIISDPDVNASYVKVTLKDGTTEIRSLDDLKGASGYNDYASTRELDRQKRETEITMMKALGYDTGELSREAFRRAAAALPPNTDRSSKEFQDKYTEIYDELQASGNFRRGRSGKGENLTEKEAEADRRARLAGLVPGTPEYDAKFSEEMSAINTEYSRTSTQRNLESANNARAQLDEMNFFDTDPTSDLKARAKIEPLIASIEQGANAELSTAQVATLERINELTHLGDVSSEMSDQQVGIIDRVFRQVSKYISDNTEGVAQEAAYAGYRNVVRNALFGSVLTPGETKAFVEQFGSLGQQRGPILAQLKVSMEQVKSNYETIAEVGDPYVVHWRTGMTQTKLQDVLQSLDERIEMVNTAMSGGVVKNPGINRPPQAATKEEAANTTLTPERKAGLDSIRGEMQ